MRIGVDVRELAGKKAGKGWYVWRLMECLREIDRENEYILYSDKEILDCKLPEKHELILIEKHGLGWHWAVKNRLKSDRIDVYWAPTSLIVPALTELKTVMTIHDLTVLLFPKMHTWKNRLIEKALTGLAVKKTSRILTISEATKDDLMRLFPKSKDKIVVAKLGVDGEYRPIVDLEIEKILKKYGLKRGYLLFVGTLEPRKNLINLIKAYHELDEKVRSENKLVIVGKKGWYFEEIFALVEEYGLKKAVIFLGYVPGEDMPAIYNGAKIFVYPSKYEGFGLPVLEAMACGVPVITSNVSSLPEVIGEAGVLVSPDNLDEITNKIEELISDDKKRDEMSRLGLIKAEEFDWKKTARATLDVLTEGGKR